MGCNCKWTEIVLAIVILVFVIIDSSASAWIIGIAAVLLLLHAMMCKNCGACATPMPEKSAPRRRRKKRR